MPLDRAGRSPARPLSLATQRAADKNRWRRERRGAEAGGLLVFQDPLGDGHLLFGGKNAGLRERVNRHAPIGAGHEHHRVALETFANLAEGGPENFLQPPRVGQLAGQPQRRRGAPFPAPRRFCLLAKLIG